MYDPKYIDLDSVNTVLLHEVLIHSDNGKMRSVEPEHTANCVSFLVNKNFLLWKGEDQHSGLLFCYDLQVNTT